MGNPEKVLVNIFILRFVLSETCIEESIKLINARRKLRAIIKLRKYKPAD